MYTESIHCASGSENEIRRRGAANEWCECSNCTNMDTHRERICCQVLDVCAEKCDDAIIHYNKLEPFSYITHHPGFLRNCLYWEVFENAWLSYKQHYGAQAYQISNKHKRQTCSLSGISAVFVWFGWSRKPLCTTIMCSSRHRLAFPGPDD